MNIRLFVTILSLSTSVFDMFSRSLVGSNGEQNKLVLADADMNKISGQIGCALAKL